MINGNATVFIRQNDAPRENKFLQLFLLAICIGGIWAVHYLSTSAKSEGLRGGVTFHAPETPLPAPKMEAAIAAAPVKVERPNHQFLVNVDVAEAQTPTKFSIDQLKGFNLIINYGDGREEAVNGSVAYHTYQTGGEYKVTLKAEFNGQIEVFQKKTVKVANAIEIDMAAPVVERD